MGFPANKWLRGYWAFNAFLFGVSVFLFGIVMVPDWAVRPVVEVRRDLRPQAVAELPVPVDGVEQQLAMMTPGEKVGQLMAVSFHPESSVASSGAMLATIKPGFVGLFSEGDLDKEELKRLVGGWQKDAKSLGMPKMVVMVDQEGGKVQRLKNGFVEIPSWEDVCSEDSVEEVEVLGRQVGEELVSVGVGGVWGPVVDRANPDSKVLAGRTCSASAEKIVAMSEAYVKGLSEAGVMAVVKHYPGLGDTKVDPHMELGSVEMIDTEVFGQLIGVASGVMVTHVNLAGDKLPCTISGRCLAWLRGEANGDRPVLVWSDAMEMEGLTEAVGDAEGAYQAIMAGVDVLVYGAKADPGMQLGVARSLVESYKSDARFARRVDESVEKVLSLKQDLVVE